MTRVVADDGYVDVGDRFLGPRGQMDWRISMAG